MSLKKITPYLLITVVVAFSYANALQNDFIWDDEFLIEKNSYLRSFTHLPTMLVSPSTAGFGGSDNFYRPTQNIYYLFIYQAFGYNKVAFHLGNILLHLLNGFLIFLVTARLFKNRSLALITSLLWVTHPTHVEAITYISGTADPMGLFFFLLCLLIIPFQNIKKNWKAYCLAVVLFALSLISKEAMIVIPALLVLVYGFVEKENRWSFKTYLPTLPFWMAAFFYMLLRKTLLNFDSTYDFYKASNIYTENILYRAYTYLATLPEYLKILFYPTDLHMERSFPVHAALNLPVIVGAFILLSTLLIGLFLFFKKKQEIVLFSWLWFFAAFVPMMGVLIPVNSFILEHWLYLPSISLFLCFSSILISTKKWHQALPWALTGICAISLVYLTYTRNKDWRTPISFYNNILKYSKGSARVHNNLAMAYSAKKNWDKAIAHYLKAIKTADMYPQTQYNLARAYIQTQQYDKAIKHLNRSLEIRPDFIYAQNLKKDLEAFLSSIQSKQPSQ